MTLVAIRKGVQMLLALLLLGALVTALLMEQHAHAIKEAHEAIGYSLVATALVHVVLGKAWFVQWVSPKKKAQA